MRSAKKTQTTRSRRHRHLAHSHGTPGGSERRDTDQTHDLEDSSHYATESMDLAEGAR